MRPALLDALPRSRFTFVVGKGGVGKSTTAAALALHWSANGTPVHLISTDPAPSISDIFGIARGADPRSSPCSSHLTIEELDAKKITDDWLQRVRAPLEQLVEKGTYLDAADVSRLTHLTLPGIDELGAALRLAELTRGDAHIVVDTAPTGHTLRLLETATLIDSWADVFFAMADKVATIAFTMVNARVRMPGEDAVDAMRRTANEFRSALEHAQFVVVTRDGDVVESETRRLIAQLERKMLRVAAIVTVQSQAAPSYVVAQVAPVELIHVPRLDNATGCDGLRAWSSAVTARAVTDHATTDHAATDHAARAQAARAEAGAVDGSGSGGPVRPVREWLTSHNQKLFWFAGKGGVGKSTCAAAAALAFARDRDVVLCSTDPAGSIGDVLALEHGAVGTSVAPRLRVLQIDAASELDRWRSAYRAEADAIFEQLGVGGSATLDRNIMSAIWDAVPPGIDELFALSEIIDAARSTETIVVDAAPTGHFLRLVEAPELALDWTHAILRILLKYGVAGKLEGFSERVLAFAKQLKHLRTIMVDAASCGAFVVTLEELVVQAQTARLAQELERIGIPVAATIVNRVPQSGHEALQGAPSDASSGAPSDASSGASSDASSIAASFATRRGACIIAPLMTAPPTGAHRLDAFVDQWRIA